MGDRFPEQAESDLTYLVDQKNGDRMIKQLLSSVIAKYRDLSVSRRSIICLSLLLRQMFDLLATDKSQYFAQPRSIIIKYVPVLFQSIAHEAEGQKNIENKHLSQVKARKQSFFTAKTLQI